jgi:cell division protein FtsI/penicillin-binding protein 2
VGVQVELAAPPTPNARPAWQSELSVRKAVLGDGRLVQRLSDGSQARLTIEPELQQAAEQLLRRNEVPYGSIVMLSVRTGRILAMAGHSATDPKLGPERLATQAWAPAASVFKLITASALLERSRAQPLTRVCYHGGLRRLTATTLADDPEKDKTCNTLADSIGMSLNPVIGKLARKLARDELLETANQFGWNARIDSDLELSPSIAEIPHDELARAQVAAGFWHTTLSPLHAALVAQAFANGGVMIRPQLLEELRRPDGKRSELPSTWRRQVTTPFVAKLVGRMMVLTTTVGTAKDGFYDAKGKAYLPDYKVAAKTGSLSRTSPALDYNWLVGFAPYDRPQVAFAVLLGNPVRWRTRPHFLARQILQAALARRPSNGESGQAKSGPG